MELNRVPALGLAAAALAALVLTSIPVHGTGVAYAQTDVAPTCPIPISVCRSAPDGSLVPEVGCPRGYRCACVPSCPECDDCAAEVCVRDSVRECRTACDCAPGLGCFDGRCIAGFAPVYCCDAETCPAGEQCQHRNGAMDTCSAACVGELWECGNELTATESCGNDRVCACTASCPLCEDCGPPVCVPAGIPTPWRCEADDGCGDGFRCECVSSCPGCDDCPRAVCVPDRCGSRDPMCEERLGRILRKTERMVRRANLCERDEQCVSVDTSTGCRGTCGEIINRMYVTPFKRRLRRLDQRICRSYVDHGCAYATPLCTPVIGACVEGRCEAVEASPE